MSLNFDVSPLEPVTYLCDLVHGNTAEPCFEDFRYCFKTQFVFHTKHERTIYGCHDVLHCNVLSKKIAVLGPAAMPGNKGRYQTRSYLVCECSGHCTCRVLIDGVVLHMNL